MTLALSSTNHSSSPVVIVLVLVAMACIFAASLFRMRRGGPGPAVNYVPRRWRAGLNARYVRRGWQAPYDEDGNRNRDRTSL